MPAQRHDVTRTDRRLPYQGLRIAVACAFLGVLAASGALLMVKVKNESVSSTGAAHADGGIGNKKLYKVDWNDLPHPRCVSDHGNASKDDLNFEDPVPENG